MPRRSRSRRAVKLFTITEAAQRLGLGYATFRTHVLPKLGATRLGRRWLITAEMLTAFLNAPGARDGFMTGYLQGRKVWRGHNPKRKG
jgi:excisionase family DNA binding protein